MATPQEQPEPTPAESIAQPEPVSKAKGVEKQLLEAFCTGAGLSTDDVTSEEMSQLLILAGKLLREMTQGLMVLLSTRSGIKGEFRLDMTRMRPTENNPFKFSADVDQALATLLLQKDKGYLPAITATQEAIRDLRAHEMALLAGLRRNVWFSGISLLLLCKKYGASRVSQRSKLHPLRLAPDDPHRRQWVDWPSSRLTATALLLGRFTTNDLVHVTDGPTPARPARRGGVPRKVVELGVGGQVFAVAHHAFETR